MDTQTLKPLSLKNMSAETIMLELLTDEHYKPLFHAAQHPDIWAHTLSSGLGEANFEQWFAAALLGKSASTQLPFVVKEIATGNVIGSTRFYEMNAQHKHLSIGYTWYIPATWGTSVNLEAKILLLTMAFESLNCIRVGFATDLENIRSQAALKKCGASKEGILRNHMIRQCGNVRDSVIFSIIQSEWDTVKLSLQQQIQRKLLNKK